MAKRGKKYLAKAALGTKQKLHKLEEAVTAVKQTTWAKFDESIDFSIKLGFDLKKTGGSVRGTFVMPGGVTKTKTIAVIAKEDKLAEAEAAGADIVGGPELIEKIKKGFLGFDVLIATPDMMGLVGSLGKTLGAKGLMPNPKAGTVTVDIKQAVKEFKAGKVEFKADKAGVIHLTIGKNSFSEEALLKNLWAVLRAINKVRPSGIKGVFLKTLFLSSTMGPAVKIDVAHVMERLDSREE